MRRHTVTLPKVLRREDLTIIVDTREQKPLEFEYIKTKRAKLEVGDYAIEGMQEIAAVERKSLQDLVACCGHERTRFEKELTRLRRYNHHLIVVEADWLEVKLGEWQGKLKPSHIKGSILGWEARGNHFFLAGGHCAAAEVTEDFLWHVAKHRHEQLINCPRNAFR